MANDKTVYQVVLDENGIAILRNLQDATTKISEQQLLLQQDAATTLDDLTQLSKQFQAFEITMGTLATTGQMANQTKLVEEVGKLLYTTEMQVIQMSRTITSAVLPTVLSILAQTAHNKGGENNPWEDINNGIDVTKGIIKLYKDLSVSGEGSAGVIGEMASGAAEGIEGGPYVAAGIATIKLLSHFLKTGPGLSPDEGADGNTLIGNNDLMHHTGMDVQDATAGLHPQQVYRLPNGKLINSAEASEPAHDPNLVDDFLHIDLNNQNKLTPAVFNKNLNNWLMAHPGEQRKEMEQDYSPLQIEKLSQKLKKDFGFNSIEEALADNSHVISFYLGKLQERTLASGEQARIKRINDEKHKKERTTAQNELIANPTIPYGNARMFDNFNPVASSSASAVGGHQAHPGSGQGNKATTVNNVAVNTNDTYSTHPASIANNIHDQVVAILTSAVADARIGTDVH